MTVEFDVGDLTQERTEAIVSPSGSNLVGGGLVNLAVHRVGGRELTQACKELLLSRTAPLEPGDALITRAFGLPSRFVIHSVAAQYTADDSASRVLSLAYVRALELAAANGISSVSFPAFATGAFGYPVAEAAPVAVRAVVETLRRVRRPGLVRFVLFGPALFDAYVSAFEDQAGPPE